MKWQLMTYSLVLKSGHFYYMNVRSSWCVTTYYSIGSVRGKATKIYVEWDLRDRMRSFLVTITLRKGMPFIFKTGIETVGLR